MLAEVDYDDIHYFVRASERAERSWDDVPEDVKNTFDRLGIPEAERKFLSGVGAQYESESVYHQVNEDLAQAGRDLHGHGHRAARARGSRPRVLRDVIPPNDNKLAALNSAVWSGGSFVYVPAGRARRDAAAGLLPDQHRVDGPVRADADHRRRGLVRALCRGLHGADLQRLVAALGGRRADREAGARIRYTTVQNWSTNVFNLVTKRAVAHEDATVEWVDCNLGSKLTMKFPSVYLLGERAHGEILSIAFAGAGQHQDAGGKIIHAAPNTTSNIFAKSISKDGGRGSYRGLLEIAKGAHGAKSKVVCDALLLDDHSRSDTYPTIRIGEDDVNVAHEATVSKVGEDQLFYLMSHGIPEEEASKLIVNGFIEPITKELPMEYAVEMNRLIELQMEGSIG